MTAADRGGGGTGRQTTNSKKNEFTKLLTIKFELGIKLKHLHWREKGYIRNNGNELPAEGQQQQCVGALF